jgi:hypothetical protein
MASATCGYCAWWWNLFPFLFCSLHDCRKIPTSITRLPQMARGYMFIIRPRKRVVIRRGEPPGRAHGGVDDHGGHLGLRGMTAESSNASCLQCGGACAWHSSRGGGRRHDRGPTSDTGRRDHEPLVPSGPRAPRCQRYSGVWAYGGGNAGRSAPSRTPSWSRSCLGSLPMNPIVH